MKLKDIKPDYELQIICFATYSFYGGITE
jgi:hypothetical protein